ncbi:BTAD domain-containing putative transcriptional regulator [Microbacterium awajiense]|uniref:BTAD domain-containing putative transcriptional regulator n=1 Tax=Microbacterium awajiense TaxID=415214 RepID=UPI0031D05D72
MQVDVFGTPQVRRDGRPLDIGGDVPRALVARLALAPGEAVPTDELIAAVWATPPDSVLSTLRSHVSRLRTAGLGTALAGTRNGYLLDVPRTAVDHARFEDAVAALDPSRPRDEQLSDLFELSSLAGSSLLDGLDAFPFVTPARAAVVEQRRRLEEDLAELALELGDHSLAVAVIAETVERHPLHERPVQLLATALARAARRSEAVDAIDAFAERMRDSDGMDPSPRLDALRASIVRLDPAVVEPTRGPAETVQRVGVAIALTRFVGRSAELRTLRAGRHRERLITIVGPAGVGKTRLAVELAREATTALDDEQYMIDLADVTDPEAVVPLIASVVRATELTVDAIARRLTRGRVLLILDNADHVLGAVAIAVDALLARTADLRFLVTSREPLRLPGEFEFVLRPLTDAQAEDAWRLFSDRALDARGGEPFAADEIDAARALCADLDGIPLALELAAARLDLLDIAQVREGIGARTTGGRHDSLRTAIAWTYELLDDDLRADLIAVARFAGPFTIEAASGVSAGPAADTSRRIAQLVGKSLVSVDHSASGRRRLRVLESTKEFVATHDTEADLTAWRARHRAWFADLAWRLAPSLRAFAAADTVAVLDGFRSDLDAALEQAIAAGDRDAAVRLVAGQAPYWYLRGLLRAGRERIDRALAVPGDVVEAEPIAWLELSNLAYQTGDAPAAFAAIARAHELGERAGDVDVAAVALARAGYGRSLFGDVAEGGRLLEAARRLAPEAEPWARSEVAMAYGQLLRGEKRLDEALEALTESHRIAASIGYVWMITSSIYVMAKTLVDARRPREAIGLAASGVAGARALEPAGALAVVHAIAGACAYVERHDVGARLLGAVDEIGIGYDYSTATAEGEDAARLRRAIAAGLAPGEFEREYRTGRRWGWDDVMTAIAHLPQTPATALIVD